MLFLVVYTYGLIVKIFNNPHQQVFELFSKMLAIFIPSAVWTFLFVLSAWVLREPINKRLIGLER